MDNPILSKLQTSPGDPLSGSDSALDREGFFAESLKLIRKVIAGRRSVLADDVPDISQEAALRLWKWLTKFEGKGSRMAEADWKSFTALQFGIEENELLAKLELTKESWERVSTRMPLSDIEIAEIANPNSANGQRSTTAGAVKKARFDARKRLKELMK
ncbi:MAG: hypothetical protein IPK01_13895 [Acidobacteria bacterium]|nr:hypothetical protein [Acidobacteriota bacterium]